MTSGFTQGIYHWKFIVFIISDSLESGENGMFFLLSNQALHHDSVEKDVVVGLEGRTSNGSQCKGTRPFKMDDLPSFWKKS